MTSSKMAWVVYLTEKSGSIQAIAYGSERMANLAAEHLAWQHGTDSVTVVHEEYKNEV